MFMRNFNNFQDKLHSYGGMEGQADWKRMVDEDNNRIVMTKLYEMLKAQENEISEQQKFRKLQTDEIKAQRSYREEQSKESKRSFLLLITSVIIALLSLLVSIFK